MTFAIKTFTMSEWIKNRMIPFDFTFEERELDPEVVQDVADMIRPPVYEPTFVENLSSIIGRKSSPVQPYPHIYAAIEGRPNFHLLHEKFWN